MRFRRFVLLAALLIIGMATWFVGSKLSSDAIGLAVGMVFGALAGIPSALLVLYASKRGDGAHSAEPPPPNEPQITVIAVPQPQRLQPPPNVVRCDPWDAQDENGFGYPLGTWGRVEPQRRIEVRR